MDNLIEDRTGEHIDQLRARSVSWHIENLTPEQIDQLAIILLGSFGSQSDNTVNHRRLVAKIRLGMAEEPTVTVHSAVIGQGFDSFADFWKSLGEREKHGN